MKAIILAFTLKGQDFLRIKSILISLVNKLAPFEHPTIAIHGFMPRKELLERGFPLDVVDTLDNLFPIQLNLYQHKPLREQIANVGSSLSATVHVIGEIKEGVAEEIELYKSMGLQIITHPIL